MLYFSYLLERIIRFGDFGNELILNLVSLGVPKSFE
jgi:hypothetical protein